MKCEAQDINSVNTTHSLNFTPVRHETIQGSVYEELRTMLMTGKFLPGQALKIADLAQTFGTSAQPVRESIRQLVAEHALDASANRSARVPKLSSVQLEDLRRTRLALESLAAELAATQVTPDQIAHLEKILDDELSSDENRDIISSISRNLEFHFSLYRYSKSEVLPPLIESLWMRIGPNIRNAAEYFDAGEGRGVEMHIQLIAALKAKDAAGARAAIENDINRFFDLIAEISQQD